MMQTVSREFDVIVFGASGFTGRLVAEHLFSRYGMDGAVRWAIAGRGRSALERVRADIGADDRLPYLLADASDGASLADLVGRTRILLTTVGPYQLYGETLLTQCVAAGTDYVDLCGEPHWMAAMIARHEDAARRSGARVVFSCGFDSAPFDCGVFFLQQDAMTRLGQPARRVRCRVRRMKGTFSGGTAASMLATLDAARRDRDVAAALANPFALTGAGQGPTQPPGNQVTYEPDIPSWSAPFVMAPINTKNVHRTNHLLGQRYGADFVYDEMVMTGDGTSGESRARRLVRKKRLYDMLLRIAPTRALLRRFVLPKPGQGPSRQERERGHFDLLFLGETTDGQLRATVTGDMDPGYGSTSKMIAESALCLLDVSRDVTPGGIWTPAAAMGHLLIERLQARAGLRFT
jgi:short subunit dehydrogenase-like uncharacterized protein